MLGDAHVTHLSADDYHRHDRRRRRELGVTPLHPDSNHLDILTQHLTHLRRGEPVLKPVYSHRDGTFQPPEYVRPARFLVVEGLLNLHTETMRSLHDVRVMLTPPEALRRAWKLKRDCTRRGYTTDEVLAELDRRQADAELELGLLETISPRGGLPERRWHVVRSAVGPLREEVEAFMAFCRSPAAKHALAKPLR